MCHSLIRWCALFLVSILFSPIANGAPANEAPPKEMVKYMKKFGYLPEPPAGTPDSETLITKEGFTEIVKKVQKYGGLPETGILDEATLKLMDTPRCGVPDIIRDNETITSDSANSTSGQLSRRKRYAIASKGWTKRHLTYFLSNWNSNLNRVEVLKKLEDAFKVWSDASPLSFSYKHSMDADLVIAFGRSYHGDGYPFDGRGNTLAHAFFPYQQPYGGDIHFDDDESWVDESKGNHHPDGVDFFMVATHEIGHSLGLAHSANPSSIMFPYYRGFNQNFRIGYDDVLGLYDLYVKNAAFEDGHVESYDPRRPTEPTRRPTEPTRRPTEPTRRPTEPTRRNPYPTQPPMSPRNTPSTTAPGQYPTPRDRRPTPRTRAPTRSPVVPARAPRPRPTIPVIPTRAPRPKPRPERPTTTSTSSPRPTASNDRPSPTSVPSHRPNRDEARRPVVNPTRTNGRDRMKDIINTMPAKAPDVCHGRFDAIATLRGEVFIFYKEFMWRLLDRGIVNTGYPVQIHSFFVGLPKSIKKIDAIYERKTDYNIVLFSGNKYWTFSGNNFTRDSPRPITDLGLATDRLDAAMVWAKNGKTYFFSGDQYWKYDETRRDVEPGYPMLIKSRWQGLPVNLDAVFTWTDGQTYFFKGNQYWRFNNQAVSVDRHFPRNGMQDWMACGL